MKTRRITGLIALATLLIATAAYGQSKPNADRQQNRQDQRLEIMKKRLELTDGQTNEIKAIMETARLQADRDREKFREERNREEARKTAQERRQETEKKIKAVLNEKQKKEYDKFREEMRQRRDNRGDRPRDARDGRRGGGRRPGR